jgi:hypothetical protein
MLYGGPLYFGKHPVDEWYNVMVKLGDIGACTTAIVDITSG